MPTKQSLLLHTLILTIALTQIAKSQEISSRREAKLKIDFETLVLKMELKLTVKEHAFRFEVFKKNVGVIAKPVPPPKDRFGRPLLGMVAATYRKGVNKFVFLTEIEFDSRYLMKPEALFAKTRAQGLRGQAGYQLEELVDEISEFGSGRTSTTDRSVNSGRPGSQNNTNNNNIPTFDDFDSFSQDEARFMDFDNFDAQSRRLETVADDGIKERILQETKPVIPGVKNVVSWEHLFSPVFDQLDCNSCYSTASISAIEAVHHNQYPDLPRISLSVQEPLDCSKENFGCDGGQPSAVMQYIQEFGVAYTRDYAYKGDDRKHRCKAEYFKNLEKKRAGARILEQILGNENHIGERILQQSRLSRIGGSSLGLRQSRQRVSRFNSFNRPSFGATANNNFSNNSNSNFRNLNNNIPSNQARNTSQFSANTNRFSLRQSGNSRPSPSSNSNNFNRNSSSFNNFGQRNQNSGLRGFGSNSTQLQNRNRFRQNNNRASNSQFSNFNNRGTRQNVRIRPTGLRPLNNQIIPNNNNNQIRNTTLPNRPPQQTQRKPKREMKYDSVKRSIYYKVTNYKNQREIVTFEDMFGKPYVPFGMPRPVQELTEIGGAGSSDNSSKSSGSTFNNFESSEQASQGNTQTTPIAQDNTSKDNDLADLGNFDDLKPNRNNKNPKEEVASQNDLNEVNQEIESKVPEKSQQNDKVDSIDFGGLQQLDELDQTDNFNQDSTLKNDEIDKVDSENQIKNDTHQESNQETSPPDSDLGLLQNFDQNMPSNDSTHLVKDDEDKTLEKEKKEEESGSNQKGNSGNQSEGDSDQNQDSQDDLMADLDSLDSLDSLDAVDSLQNQDENGSPSNQPDQTTPAPHQEPEPESENQQNQQDPSPAPTNNESLDLSSLDDLDNLDQPQETPQPDPTPTDTDPVPSNNTDTPSPPVSDPTKPQQGSRYEELKGFYFIRQNVIDLIRALQYGPVVVAHFVSEPFKFYESGVFDGDGCKNAKLEQVNHASVIVGYDLEDKIPYFKFRNSWADDWGEKGYYRIKIGELTRENKGTCLVAGTPFMVLPHLVQRSN